MNFLPRNACAGIGKRQIKVQTGRSSPKRKVNRPWRIYEHLQILIKGRFSGDDALALNLLLEELHAHLINGENQAETVPAIHEVLNRIEDLVDAFEIAGRSR